MSSKAGKLAKSVNNKKLFPDAMYETFIGSTIICNYIFEQWNKEEVERVIKLWKTVKRNPTEYFKTIPDTWNILKIWEVFGLKRSADWPLCVVTSDFNCLCVPYATDEDKVIPLTVREDGFLPATVRKAKKIVVVDWEGTNEENKPESITKSEEL